MKQRENYVAPSSSECASRIRTSILAGSAHIHGNDFPAVNTGDAKERISVVGEKGSVD
ncbi:MAG: hypothetical protein IJR86_00810 [Bacteroidaceae bacterium]|nr:hypothetical protein [Bacteroidaceae bacterium]